MGISDEIKQKLDVVEIVGEYIKLAKAGRNYKANCPFHGEKTPSFMVSPERQIWHCFGCGEGGDIFKFVMMMEGIEFGDALRILAKRAGVILKRQDPQIQSQKKRIYEINELAAKFFAWQLEKSPAGQKAKKYLLDRGMEEQTIKDWRIGWAADDWHALCGFLVGRGYKDSEIFQAGLSVESGRNTFHDRFRGRIIFPIRDIQGQTIAFGGRIFGIEKSDEMAKYLNSPQTELYDKSRVLFGLDKSKMEIRAKDRCVIVEGYMDLIMSYQAGVKNVAASSGTALTENHLNIIGRYTKNLAMAFDSDSAGAAATKRSVDMALRGDFNVRVIPMKEKDPADIVKKDPADWLQIVESKSQSVMEFYFADAFSKFDGSTLDGQREIKNSVLPMIKAIASNTEQSHWLADLASRLRVSESDLLADMKKIKDDPVSRQNFQIAAPSSAKGSEPQSRQDGLEERFLGLCLNNPGFLRNAPEVSGDCFQNKALANIFGQLQNLAQDQKEDLINHLRKNLSPELKIQVDYLSLKIEQQPAEEEMEIISEIESCVKELKIIKLKRSLVVLSAQIKEAQGSSDKSEISGLLEKFSEFSMRLSKLLGEAGR